MSAGTEGTLARVRQLLADAVELVQVRLELLSLEAREDIGQLLTLGLQAALALVLLSFGLIFLALFLTVLLWDSQRLLALGIFTTAFLGGGVVLALLAWQRLRRGLRLFRSSIQELQADRERLRS
ncbi:MAG: phage holin family protein [Burkholderiales bacterium]|uniref:Phage holin family protein n=1 Tax=Ottowia pentelensis TaxID=511108 RepID=A0ABV6PWN7_9BURK|nr:phage holin family protein [Ottowia sp.]MBN9406238.1 phage holin family protein [Burkholderiales bacterium]MBS0401586.1 phage holin family protein [Pseudomonadota bacterium]MBS0414064.1 phage holin family protein [Pseudomonadota bacterium]HMN57125.1 phage holin family protein [Ottowia sp.]